MYFIIRYTDITSRTPSINITFFSIWWIAAILEQFHIVLLRQQLAKSLPKLPALFNSISEMNIFQQQRMGKSWKMSPCNLKKEWDFLHVLGRLDGHYLPTEYPRLSGSLYYNYKGYFSMVLLAICHTNYCFALHNYFCKLKMPLTHRLTNFIES